MRTIKEEGAAQQAIDKGIATWPRLEEVFLAVQWRISRKPESGMLVSDGYYLIASTDVIVTDGAPRITLLYSFDSSEVTIYDINIESP